jgi:hypothetical protein
MREQRTDLKSFDMAQLQSLRELRGNMYCGGNNRLFFDELEDIITRTDKKALPYWERMDNDDIILGEVWSQPIGYFRYKNTVHKYEYLYVASTGLVIAEHEHEKLLDRCGCQQVRKIKEWYIFPNGNMKLCRKGHTHRLVHQGSPMYVISLKIWNHTHWKTGME